MKIYEKDGVVFTDESTLQRACLRWFSAAHPNLAENIFSIPNGGKLGGRTTKSGHSIQASRMVGEGMKRGVFDLFFAKPAYGFHGIFIEVKTPIGKVSEHQINFAKTMMESGYACCVCRSLGEFELSVSSYLYGKFNQVVENEKIFKTPRPSSEKAGSKKR